MARRRSVFAVLSLACGAMACLAVPARAQVQTFILAPGSSVGAESRVIPKDCVTAPDGTITCNTQLVNPPGTTDAKPLYSPWDK